MKKLISLENLEIFTKKISELLKNKVTNSSPNSTEVKIWKGSMDDFNDKVSTEEVSSENTIYFIEIPNTLQ